ncbi:Restriction endonuclease subunit S [Acinetobacter sp. 8I-beige]|uniref:restriction endonuclease subunit S n=1 Tax=Acinetobacter sp. 8I-beige TaxID=2653125 RepID=UPI0012F40DA3|nr:restriction endonuclease subunit S [Acinetobacter sp. 8I-beige]VXA83128.1 Restriction endonuclease subunit S [Acinetobacter sp. 8I-beige]
MTQNKQTLLDEKQTPEGYKKTEFGNIPADWSVLCLGELGKFKNGINKDANQFGFGKPFVNLMDVFGKISIDKTVSFELINSTELDRKEYSLNRGDVLFIRSSVKPSGVGLTAVITDNLLETVFSGFLIRFRSDGNLLDLGFKKYCFNANYFRKQVISNSTVSANTNINQEVLKKLELIFPKKLEEQQKIATALSDIDTLISELEKLIEKKQAIKTATMQQLLTGKTRLPEFALREDGTPKGYKDSELGQIPEDWEIYPLRSLLKSQPKYGINAAATALLGNLPTYIRITDINEDGKFSPTEKVGVNSPLSENYILERGDIVLARTGASVGKSYLYDEDDGELIYAGFLIKISPASNLLCSKYLSLYFQTKEYWDWIATNSMRSGQPGINGNQYANLKIALPAINEQLKISRIFIDIDKELEKLKIKLNKVSLLKQGMMQELLTGKTRLV